MSSFSRHIMSPRLEINVTGTGTAIRRAERGILMLSVRTESSTSVEQASIAAAVKAKAIRELILPHCSGNATSMDQDGTAAIAHYSMTTRETTTSQKVRSMPRDASLDREIKYETIYHAHTEHAIEFAEFDVLETLVAQFAAMEHVTISRVDWALTDATLASIEVSARKAAAWDALARARDYAEVFGGMSEEDALERTLAVNVSDKGYHAQTMRPHRYRLKLRGPEKKIKGLQFEPEDVKVQVEVDAKFTVERAPPKQEQTSSQGSKGIFSSRKG